MKIAHINLARGFRGGERQTHLLVKALDQRHCQQRVVVRRDDALHQRLLADSFQHTQVIGIAKPFALRAHHLRDVDWVHAHEGKAQQLAAVAWLRYRQPYLMTRRVMNAPKQNIVSRFVYQRARCIVCLSRAIETVIAESLPDAPETAVIPSAFSGQKVNRQQVAAVRRRFAGDADSQKAILVGHAGALDMAYKGQQHLIAAAHQLKPRHPGLQLLLLGQGADDARLRELAGDADWIHFLGFQQNVNDYIAALDVFAFPSLSEGLGSVVLDAFAECVPVVASATGGIVDLVEGEKNGLLVAPGDADALAAALDRCIVDPSLRVRLAENAHVGLKKYSIEAIAEQYLALYRSL